MMGKVESLKRFDVFAELPDKALEEIARLTKQEKHPEGTILFKEGSKADKLYLLLEGKISLEIVIQLGSTGTPRRAALNIAGPDNAVGWSSMVPPYSYTSTGVCIEDVNLLVLPGEEIRSYMMEHPDIGYTICQHTASLIRGRMTNATAMLMYFLSIVSHELKRPLAAVENYLQILSGGYAGELTPKQTRLIERSTLRISDLRNLISDILDFARMQPDQIRADFEELDPAELGAEAIEEVRLAASQKNVHLKAIGPTEYLPIVAARRRLRQVIANLLANAIKFSPEGSTVTLTAQDKKEALKIVVMDEGIGIPKDEQEHIFDDFFRASNVGDFRGAGLGLSIAHKIIEAHEGTIEVESPYEEGITGAKFTITIPRTLHVPGKSRKPEPAANQEGGGRNA